MALWSDRNIRTELSETGVLIATFDMPGRTFNVFSADIMDSLEQLLDQVALRKDIRAVVLSSGKDAFFAGADLEMVRTYTQRARSDSPAGLHKLCGRLGCLFRRIEVNGKPFVAAVNGLALGGGLELALACHERVAAENAEVGLPEIKLGLLPGAGGTQRLPRLIGKPAALQIMLRGDSQRASRAHELGIIDMVVAPDRLLNEARRRAVALAGTEARAPWDRPGWHAPVHASAADDSDNFDIISTSIGLGEEERRRYPAYETIMSCVVGGWSLAMDAACHWEMDCFVKLIRDPTAGNMIRSLFLDRQRATKVFADGAKCSPRAVVAGTQAGTVAAFLRSARVEIVDGEGSGTDSITIATDPGAPLLSSAPNTTVAWLRGSAAGTAEFGAAAGVWVSDTTSYGRAVEVNIVAAGQGDSTNGLGAGAAGREWGAGATALELARCLRSTPLLTRGMCLFQELSTARDVTQGLESDAQLLAIALAAARVWSSGAVSDPAIADSAAVIGGFFPPYTGGPYRYLSQRGAADVRASAAKARAAQAGTAPDSLFAVPTELETLLAALQQ